MLPIFVVQVLVATASALNGLSLTLRPTEPPSVHDLLRRFHRRQSEFSSESSSLPSSDSTSATRTLLAGPDDTCGYLGGQSERSWGCATGNCFFATPTPILVTIAVDSTANSTATVAGLPTPGSVLCCDPKTGCPSVPAPTACVDRYNNVASTTASGSASSDSMTLTCTSGLYIFCNTLTFTSPYISAHFCNYISNTAVQNATTTYSGQLSHAFTPTQPVFAVTYTPPPPSTSVSSTSVTSVAPSATAAPVDSEKKSNKAAISGGVVGGIAGLLLMAGAVVLFIRWRNSGLDDEEGPKTETVISQVVHKHVHKH